jgi:hypothetical protein
MLNNVLLPTALEYYAVFVVAIPFSTH